MKNIVSEFIRRRVLPSNLFPREIITKVVYFLTHLSAMWRAVNFGFLGQANAFKIFKNLSSGTGYKSRASTKVGCFIVAVFTILNNVLVQLNNSTFSLLYRRECALLFLMYYSHLKIWIRFFFQLHYF